MAASLTSWPGYPMRGFPARLPHRTETPLAIAGFRGPRGPISRILSPAFAEVAVISLALPLPEGSCSLPGDAAGTASRRIGTPPYLALLQVGFSSIPIHIGTWCALTAPFHPCLCPSLAGRTIGGLVSVALSVASRRLGVTQHLAQWSPDFPPRRIGATTWPSWPGNSIARTNAGARWPRHWSRSRSGGRD